VSGDYYDPYPRWRIRKTAIVAGQLGCGAPAVARHVAARTGLPFVEIDRLVEHEAGRSLARIAFEEGRDGVEQRAESILGRIVGQSPYGLVALDHAWVPTTVRKLLMHRTYFMHLKRSHEYLATRIGRELHRAGDWMLDGKTLPPTETADLPPLHGRRAPLLADARIVLDAGDRHIHDVAEILLDSLEHVADAERL